MTPDFTLDKAAKQKLIDVREEWTKAQQAFMQEHQDELKQAGQEQMEAYKANDKEKIKAAAEKYQQVLAKGPKSEDYVVKAKAALSPEQVKAVDEKVKKNEEAQKAMMDRWRDMEKNQPKNPGGGDADKD